ncbi:retrovirus-related pol polyprotein from transposon TNT 1-94 [Tanacetum coccineum]
MKKKKINITPINFSELNKLAKDFGKCFVPQQGLSTEQKFWLQSSDKNSKEPSTSNTPVKIEVPYELPKVSLVNKSLKKQRFHLASFDKVVKVRTTPDAITEGSWDFEHTKKVFLTKIIPWLNKFKDLFKEFDKGLRDEITKVQTVFTQMKAVVEQCSVNRKCCEIQQLGQNHILRNYEYCVEFFHEVELVNKNDVYIERLKQFSNLKKHCISLEVAKQLNKEFFQKDKSSDNQNHPEIQEYFEQNDLKAQLQAKDTVISKLKETIHSLRENVNPAKVKKDIDVIEIINIKLEHSVAKLLFENEKLHKEREHLKKTYKELYDSIKLSRVHEKEQCGSLIANLNSKSKENIDLKTQIQEKVFTNATLKNKLRKLKGKTVIDTIVLKPHATTIDPGMFKLNLEPLALKVLKNKDAHLEYIKHSREHADILREIVENTCLCLTRPSEKLVAVTLKNKDKKVRFVNPVTSSSNTEKRVNSHKLKDSNQPLLHSTGVIGSTGASGSKPTGNTKNNRISQSSSSNKTNKVEDQSRSVKSRKNKKNHVAKTKSNAYVMQSMLNVNSKFVCDVCNECLFDANHDKCVLDYVYDVNVLSKSKPAKHKNKKQIWKPTGKVVQIVMWYLDSGCSKHMTETALSSPILSINFLVKMSEEGHGIKAYNIIRDMNSSIIICDSEKKNENSVDTCNKCLELKVELVNKNDVYIELSKCDNQNHPEIQEYFKQNDLKAQLQAKDTVISKLNETIHSLRENENPAKVKKDIDEIETINIELEHSCPNCNVVFLSGYSKHMTGNRSQLTNFVNKFLGTVKFSNNQIAKIMGYGLEVAFHKHTCFVRNLEGVDLLMGSWGTNLYTLSIGDIMKSSPICLLSKASKTKSWLWHRCLSHLNFGTINQLAKQGLVRGLLKLKFEKGHLCSACSLGKSKKQSHKPKSEDTNQEKLYLLHMDLCGPMRVESINRKKYILVIFDDCSRFTWVKFLRSKDEALEFIIKSSCHSLLHPEPFPNTPSSWKTPYELLHDRKPDLSYLHLFGAICYPTNDSEDLGKLKAKPDVDFDELTAMASEQSSSGPTLHEMTPGTLSSGLVPQPPSSTPFVPQTRDEWDTLLQPLFNEYFHPPPCVDHPAPEVAALVFAVSTSSPSSTSVDQDAPSPSTSKTLHASLSHAIPLGAKEADHDIEVTHIDNKPQSGIPIPEPSSEESSSHVDIPNNVHSINQPPEHISKWTKDYLIDNLKEAITESYWIEAMQEELNEFEFLKVWELVPCPDHVMIIILKWIYKVKLDKLGGVLKNKAWLVARGYRQEEGIDFEESFAPFA